MGTGVTNSHRVFMLHTGRVLHFISSLMLLFYLWFCDLQKAGEEAQGDSEQHETGDDGDGELNGQELHGAGDQLWWSAFIHGHTQPQRTLWVSEHHTTVLSNTEQDLMCVWIKHEHEWDLTLRICLSHPPASLSQSERSLYLTPPTCLTSLDFRFITKLP